MVLTSVRGCVVLLVPWTGFSNFVALIFNATVPIRLVSRASVREQHAQVAVALLADATWSYKARGFVQ
jgi:hypothetical protein